MKLSTLLRDLMELMKNLLRGAKQCLRGIKEQQNVQYASCFCLDLYLQVLQHVISLLAYCLFWFHSGKSSCRKEYAGSSCPEGAGIKKRVICSIKVKVIIAFTARKSFLPSEPYLCDRAQQNLLMLMSKGGQAGRKGT